jgi:CBS-domain-containing membrane protein
MLTTFLVYKNFRAKVGHRKFMMSMMAKDVMTDQVAKLRPDEKNSTAIGIFKENLFHAMPIIDKKNKVAGMLSTFDLLNYAFDKKRLLSSN